MELQLRKPKMILFDYGQTLLAETEYDPLRATRVLMQYAVKNPRDLTPEQIGAFAEELYEKVCMPARSIHREVHTWQFERLLYDLLQIEFSIPREEQEFIFFGAGIRAVAMPHVAQLLDFLAENNIRRAVVSNISSSGKQLKERIARALPGYEFEFVIASSEYAVCKPDPLIFQLACAKADLEPQDIWFCGDHPRFDVEGSYAAGMTPVWFTDTTIECTWRKPESARSQCPHLHLHDWRELIELIKNLES